MAKRDLTLGASGELHILDLEKSRSELLKGASDSVSKLQRLLKRYEDQISKPGAASEPFGPYHSAHPMTECIADQKSKENPPRDPAAVCQFIRTRSQKADFSMDGAMTEWDSMSKAQQDVWVLEKVTEDDPEILEDMAEGGVKPAVDLSIGAAGAEVPTIKPPIKPVVVTPGTEKAFSPEARRAALEARRKKKKPEEAKKPRGVKLDEDGFPTSEHKYVGTKGFAAVPR
ncbi:unnamed protein product, partial [marine sediment metagenome]